MNMVFLFQNVLAPVCAKLPGKKLDKAVNQLIEKYAII